jgi:predicted PurR-regulated permease PerM
MASDASSASLGRALLVLASLAIVVAALYVAQKVLIPLVLAVLFTFILAPPVMSLQRLGLNRTWAVLVVVGLVFALLGALAWVVTVEFRELAAEIPEHKTAISTKIASLFGTGEGVLGRLQRMFTDIAEEVQRELQLAPASGEAQVVLATPGGSGLLGSLSGLALPFVEGLASSLLVIVLVIFMLIKREELRNRLLRLLGHGRLTRSTRALDDAGRRISRFLLVQSAINLGFGVLLTAGLFLIGVPYVLLWGLLAAGLRFIPYIGVWIAIVLPFLFCVAIFPGWLQPLLVLALALALELFAANVADPLLLGQSTGVSPPALLVAAAFWAWLWGPIGLLLSTPLTACLAVLGKYVPDLEFLDVLLGAHPPLATNVSYYQRLVARDQDEAETLVEEYVRTHPPETLYDEVLLPALVSAGIARQHGELGEKDQRFVMQATRDILHDLPAATPNADGLRAQRPPPAASAPVQVFACTPGSATDAMALEMFQKILQPTGCRVKVLSGKVLPAKLVSRIEEGAPQVVCVAALPPSGVAQARYLCKHLRAHFPKLKIAVGRWGDTGNLERTRQKLQEAGADYVGTTLLESRRQILSLCRAGHLSCPTAS